MSIEARGDVAILLYRRGFSYKDIGNKLNRSRSWIHKTLNTLAKTIEVRQRWRAEHDSNSKQSQKWNDITLSIRCSNKI